MKHPTPEQLSAFHDGIADAKTLVAVETHLNECAECHEVLASLERQDRALNSVLSHDPGDDHFELLAARIERKLGTRPQGETAGAVGGLRGFLGTLGEDAARAFSALRERLEGLAGASKKLHAGWAGAVAALLVGLGIVLLNVNRAPVPLLRDQRLEQRSGQAAEGSREADQFREAAPRAGALGREAARDDARNVAPPSVERLQQSTVRPVEPPAVAPQAGAATKPAAPSARARTVKSTPTGEDVRAPGPESGFAKAPGAEPQDRAGLKPRRAMPLEESQPKVEGGTRSLANAKEAGGAKQANEAGLPAAAKRAAPSPTATLPPEPEAPQPAAQAPPRDSGARPTRAAYAEPQAHKMDASVAQALIPMCGVVRDTRGRPIASAAVTLVSQGRGVSSDAQGRFCIDAPPGVQTLSVIAVGFAPLQFDVQVVAGSQPLVLTLHAVSVLEGSAALRGKLHTLGGFSQSGAPGELLPGFPDSLQPVASRAIRATLEAERARSAPRYDAAAVEWERVRERAGSSELEAEARFRIAEARFRAAELMPTPKRSAAANEALTSYLVRAPLGARRDTASAWLGRVKP